MFITRAFLKGQISPTMLQLWESKRGGKSIHESWWIGIAFIIIAIANLLLYKMTDSFDTQFIPVVLGILFGVGALMEYGRASFLIGDFLHDTKMLRGVIPDAPLMSEKELRSGAEYDLTYVAYNIDLAHAKGEYQREDELRMKLREHFDALLRFGLADREKGYGPYFDAAKNRKEPVPAGT